ncbi:DUF11 domain-containing protein [Curtobacterium sp. MCBD17_028]|uniref:DUF7927 domain-containing protein n=1 Tax=Curtobacterium sp. MCBD17_028 TaxID=2175670 RepID=UPI0015E8C43A|nr:DUF11 domain-containing protein [Curtobacterium sp. MCBD17_028]
MSSYDEGQARSTTGQTMSARLPGGYVLRYTIRTATPSGYRAGTTRAASTPTYKQAYIGTQIYRGIPGRPALGFDDARNVGARFALSDIHVEDASGTPVTGWGMVAADAETSETHERIDFASDVPLGRLDVPDPARPACSGGVTGIGSTAVRCEGGRGPFGALVLQANEPTSIEAVLSETNRSGAEAVAFAFVTSRLTLRKAVDGRSSPSDSFDTAITSPQGTVLASATTGGADTSTTGSTTVLPDSRGGAFTLSETATTGTGTDLSGYAQQWTCTNANAGSPTRLPSGGGTVQRVTPAAGDDITCTVTNSARSYTVTKSASATVAQPGDRVSYTITVANTGNVGYTSEDPASFTDDLTGVLDDARYRDDASGGAVVTGKTLSWSGALAAGATRTITYSVTVDDPDQGDHRLRNVVAPSSPGGTCGAAGCATTTPVRSYVLTKTADRSDVVAGSTVRYTITVENTGAAPYTDAHPASFDDDLAQVLDDAAYGRDATASGGAVAYDEPGLRWSGPLAVGAKVTVTYSVVVGDPGGGGDGRLDNTVVGTAPGANCTTTHPDPDCTAHSRAAAYTVEKRASASVADPGDVVTYTVRVSNTGKVDYTAGNPASFTDDLSGVFDDADHQGDTPDGATISGNTLSWSGALAVGRTKTITYSVAVHDPDTGDHELVNSVRPTAAGGSCGTAGCATTTKVRSLAVSKTADVDVVTPGGTVTYTVTMRNTGTADYTAAHPATFVDDLSGVLDDATVETLPDDVTYREPELTWSGPLGAGASEAFTYSVTVGDRAASDADDVLTNTVVAPHSNCRSDLQDPTCVVRVPVRSYSLQKTADTDHADPGDVVTYTVTVENTGAVAFTDEDPVSFEDDLSAVLDDATYDRDADHGATVSDATLAWSGALGVGETTRVSYSVTVDDPDTGDRSLVNVVTPSAPGGACVTDAGCTTTTVVAPPEPEPGAEAAPDEPVTGAAVRTGGTVAEPGAGARWWTVLLGAGGTALAGVVLFTVLRRRQR